MKNRALIFILTLTTLLLLVACGTQRAVTPAEVQPTAASAVEERAMDDAGNSERMAAEEMASGEMASGAMASGAMASEDDSMAEHSDQPMANGMADASQEMAEGSGEMAMSGDLVAWQMLPLTNARTGETFTLADFAGQTVFVEPMATWCSNCRRQLGNVKDASAELAGEEVVFVALSVETSISDDALADYADEAGFDWLFAVLTNEILQELAAEFGQTIANPPSTPHFVIRPDGSTTDLITGIEPAEQIVTQIRAAQG